MKSRLENIIKDLDKCIEEDVKISSQIFGLATASIQKNKELLEQLQKKMETHLQNSSHLISVESYPLTQEFLQKQYKNYNEAYKFYHESYQITCSRGWENLVKAINKLSSPKKSISLEDKVNTLENKVTHLEETINILVEIIKNLDG